MNQNNADNEKVIYRRIHINFISLTVYKTNEKLLDILGQRASQPRPASIPSGVRHAKVTRKGLRQRSATRMAWHL